MGWKALKSWVFLASLVTLGAPGASATTTLTCTIDDANLALSFVANTNSQHGTIVHLQNSHLTLKSRALAVAGQRFKIEPEHIIQQWFLDRELRIAISIDDDKGALLLAIFGQLDRGNEGYFGRYHLSVSFPHNSTWMATGQVKGCGAG